LGLGIRDAKDFSPVRDQSTAMMCLGIRRANATTLFAKRLTPDEREAGSAAAVLGLAFIGEGGIPFGRARPVPGDSVDSDRLRARRCDFDGRRCGIARAARRHLRAVDSGSGLASFRLYRATRRSGRERPLSCFLKRPVADASAAKIRAGGLLGVAQVAAVFSRWARYLPYAPMSRSRRSPPRIRSPRRGRLLCCPHRRHAAVPSSRRY
jgi:hypothetical protein